ncbi:cytochrome c oxidase assembly protein [Mycobacterium sp. 29Ha]|uniref:cytochrome c oxidase assembly protein n=1 Tax=Mycobacterium sp. 29Ha TaxID=2939268 RepID=UPI002938E729|nr:cytochrome c oxidase assembly protein [Mycobacterium sp. 29Ha]MDV3131343.1 bifunctional copper resistance protein CopD/cytochrome c oxidase assembly protein [Mycobacterium sp. 29Ha]
MTATSVAAGRRRTVWPVLLGVALVAGVTAAAIGALVLADALEVTGLSDPGPITTYGLSFLRAAGEVAAMVAIGHFLFAAFLVPPQTSGVLDVDGYRAVRVGAVACALWAVCAALLVALTVSDVSGVPLTDLTPLDVWSAADLVETTAAWRTTSILAAVVAAASLTVLRWSWTPGLLVGGLVTLVPVAVTGHSSTGGSHDIATNSLLIHLIAGSLWAGGLVALLVHALRGGSGTDVAARRFSGLALGCFAAMAVSGLVNAAVRIDVSNLWDSTYGLLLVAKVAALVGLGVIGWRQRRSSIRALQLDPTSRRPLLRLALGEALLFGIAVGVAVGLGRTPPPPATSEPSPAEVALGFDLPEAPTISGLFTEWRFDLIFGTAAVVMACIYLAGVYRLARRGDPWSKRRTTSWLIGCVTMLFATSSGLGMYMAAMYSMHAIVQLLLTIVVPALLVQGAPVTLALTALRAAEPGAAPGPREWVQGALDSPMTRLLTQPWTALAILVMGVYGLCIAGVFDIATSEHAAHMATIGYFLFSGTLFFAVVSGGEPVPRLMPKGCRVALTLFALSQFVFAGIVVVSMQGVLGGAFYRSLKLNWHTNLLSDQRTGGVIVSVGGALAMLTVIAILTAQRTGRLRTRDALASATDA